MCIITKVANWLKRQIRDQFGFSKAETNGVLVLLGLIICFLTAPHGLKWYYQQTSPSTQEADIVLLDKILAELKQQQLAPNNPPQKKGVNPNSPAKSYKKQKKHATDTQIKSFDINTVDRQKLETLPGIGSTRSARIIKYRNKLGGFIRHEQYTEVYGLDSLSIASMLQCTYISSNFQPRKIDINQDDFKTLLAHPYLSYEQVQRILQFRNKRGRFTRIEELLENNILEKVTFEKMKAYLTLYVEKM